HALSASAEPRRVGAMPFSSMISSVTRFISWRSNTRISPPSSAKRNSPLGPPASLGGGGFWGRSRFILWDGGGGGGEGGAGGAGDRVMPACPGWRGGLVRSRPSLCSWAYSTNSH